MKRMRLNYSALLITQALCDSDGELTPRGEAAYLNASKREKQAIRQAIADVCGTSIDPESWTYLDGE